MARAEGAAADQVRPAISKSKLGNLLRLGRTTQKDINELAGTLGQSIKDAVEKDHLHRKAFNVIKMADRMEPDKLADFRECLMHYFDISGLNERADSAPRLPIEEGTEEEEEGAEASGRKKGGRGKGKEKPNNVAPFPKPNGIAAE